MQELSQAMRKHLSEEQIEKYEKLKKLYEKVQADGVSDLISHPQRMENESQEEYRKRQKLERDVIRMYMWGEVIEPSGTFRKDKHVAEMTNREHRAPQKRGPRKPTREYRKKYVG